MQRGDQVFFGDCPLLEELFHQLVVAFGDQLDQFFVRFLRGRGQVGGDLCFFPLAIAAEFVGIGLHLHQVDDAAETFFLADRELQGNNRAPESTVQGFENSLSVGAISIHSADYDDARQIDFFCISPDALGDDLDAGDSVNHYQRGFDHGEHGLGFVDKHAEARSIEEIDFGLAPLREGDPGADRHLAGDFFLVVIGGRAAIVDPAHALGCARREKCSGDKRGFSSVPVTDQGYVADICAFVNFHGFTPRSVVSLQSSSPARHG